MGLGLMSLGIVGLLAGLGLSARWNWWRLPARGIPILMYHKIGDPPPGSKLKKLWVSAGQFWQQMAYLKKHHYLPLTFFDMLSLQEKGRAVPDNGVVISFDDGYLNNYEVAFPILREFNFKAVIFLVVNAVGKDNFWHDPQNEIRIPMLSWAQAEKMQSWGIEFGSHTMSHIRLSKLGPKTIQEELDSSRRIIAEKLRKEPVSFANPYGNGQDDQAIQGMIQKAGYRWACSVHQGKADLERTPYCLNRIFVRGDDNMFDFHLNMTRGKARL